MKKLICLLALFSTYAHGIPLDPWNTWNTNFPYVARQIPPSAMIARGSGTDQYYVLEVDPVTGELPVALSGASISIDYSGETGQPVPADAAFIGGEDPIGNLQGIAVGTDGVLKAPFSAVPATTFPSESASIAAQDTNGDLRNISVDLSGRLITTVQSSALPSGAATSALQTTGNTSLSSIDGKLTTTNTTLSSIDTKTPALGQSNMAGSTPVVIASNQSAVPVTTSNLPATVATDAGDVNASTIRVTEGSRDYSDGVAYNYGSGSVTTATWTQVIASTAADINVACITDQSGQVMELGVGASLSETRIFLVAPGFSGCIPLRIAAGSRVSVKAVSATASSGYLTISGMY